MKNYILDLSAKDFNKMAMQIEKIEKSLPIIKDKILKGLAEYTKERIQYYINQTVNLEYSTKNLYESIVISNIFNETIKVYTECAYAKYVEYGTGIVGSSNPHPDFNGGYKAEGWWYPTDAFDPNPRKKQLENGDWIAYTEGQKAHKFMYNAFQDLKQNYLKIAKQILKKEGIF